VHWHSDDSVEVSSEHASAALKNDVSAKLPTLKEQAANVLSRGEKKLLITALRLSQLPLLLNAEQNVDSQREGFNTRATPVVLLDDITAELDGRAIEILLSTLSQLPCQVFMSSLTDDIVPLVKELWSNPNMFHVKQGNIQPL
jgi:DNA replication and repair protein RecF